MNEALLKALTGILGEDRVLHEKSDLIPYCSDYHGSPSYEVSGNWPLCAVLPESTEEVVGIVKLAIEHETPIVPRGGGSNQVEAVAPPMGSIVLSTARMRKIVDIDETNMTVTAQPGIGLREMDEILEPHGMILAQEQGSYKTANIGGAISTNGISARNNRYGDIGENVLSLEVVLGDGRVMRTGPKVCNNSAGYHLHKLFVAAEGTLGIITEITLRVMPKPEVERGVAALFDSWETVKQVALAVMKSGINRAGGDVVDTLGENGERSYVAVVGLEGNREEVDVQESLVKRLYEEYGGVILDSEKATGIWRITRIYWCGTPHPNLRKDDLVAAMPLQHYEKAHRRIETEVFPKYGIVWDDVDNKVIVIGRRPLACFDFLYDPKKTSHELLKEAFADMMKIVAEYGGAGPGCHAVGELLRESMAIQQDPVAMDIMMKLKQLFDPHNIMNPGKKLPSA